MHHKGNKYILYKTLRSGLTSCAIVALYTFSSVAHAKETPPSIEHSALKNLARDFVSKIGTKLKTYDAAQATHAKNDDALSTIVDGEFLLLRVKSDKFTTNSEIGAIKNHGTIYYHLEDVISQLELAINYDRSKRTGSGWLLREDWLVRFDFPKKEVVSRGVTYNVHPNDIMDEEGDIYISASALQQWLSIETVPDIAQQYVDVKTPYPYPALARDYRAKSVTGGTSKNQAVLPRLEQQDKWLSLNTADIDHDVRVRKSDDRETSVTHRNTTSLQGNVANHNAYAITSWDNREQLTNVRARLTKDDENPVLLGPLKARSYTIGDTDLPTLPLTGNTMQELGFRVNNNPLKNADFQQTRINGDSLPGWDVELYRDGFMIDRLRVGDDARYEFPEVELFAGDNLFEVYFYGPQGQVRRDAFNIPVNESFLTTQNNTYDFSVTFNDAQVYSKFKSEDEDADTPHLIARYNKIFGDTLAYAGIRARQVDGEQKGYLATGFTDIWQGFVFDGNAAIDEQSNTSADLGVRKNINDWRLSLRGDLKDEEYIVDGETTGIMSVTGTATRNFIMPYDTYGSFTTSGQYRELANDSTITSGSVGYSHQIGRFNINDSIRYEHTKFADNFGQEDTRISNLLSARYSWGRLFTRAGLTFDFKPESEIRNYFSQLSYQPSNRLTSDLFLEHTPESNLTEARLNLTYRHDKFRISPFFEINNQSEIETGVRLSTSLINDPSKALPVMTSDRMTGRGIVSSFVYHDKNGNFIFDNDDVPLPDVTVLSVNTARKEKTDERGYSLIKDLPENFVTDIKLDKETLPDPFMISGFEGISIFPRAGQISEITFPVHLAGEIDGTVYLIEDNKKLSASGISLDLIPMDGKSTEIINIKTAQDGFFIASHVPPGNYLFGVNPASAARFRAGGQEPVPIKIGYDGTVISAQDFTLQKGRTQVPVIIKPYAGKDYTSPFFAMETGGEKQSKLASLLSGMMEKKNNISAKEGLTPLAIGDMQDLNVLLGKDWNAHYERCQLLNDNHIPCKVILFIPEKNKKSTKTAGK